MHSKLSTCIYAYPMPVGLGQLESLFSDRFHCQFWDDMKDFLGKIGLPLHC